jgi:hypothetical protein
MPVFWASSADATFVSCQAGERKDAKHYGVANDLVISTECVSGFLDTSTDVAGQARPTMNSFGGIGVESRLIWATNTSNAHAYAFGYFNGQGGMQQVPGCMSDDAVWDQFWATTSCPTGIHRINIVVNGN